MNDMLTKNLAFLLRGDKQAQAAIAERIGVSQGTISKWSKLHEKGSSSEPEFRNMAILANKLGVPLEDLAYRDIEREGLSRSPSQPATLDISRIGLALTSVDKALRDMEIQGRLGTLAEPLQFAYSKAFGVVDPGSKAERERYDELVEANLRGWRSGRTGTIETGEDEDSSAKAPRKAARTGGKRRDS